MADLLKKETTKFTWQEKYSFNEREIFRFKKVQKYFKEGKLLDVGCRGGGIRKYIDKDISYYGLDFIDAYRQYIDNFFCVDIAKENVPVNDNFFDNVYLGEILEHISNFFFVFEEVYRILKPGGRIILTVPNNFNIAQALGIVRYKRYKKKNLNIERMKNSDTHIHSFYEPDLLKISQMIGFKPIDCDRFYNFFGKLKLPEVIAFKPFAKFILFVAEK